MDPTPTPGFLVALADSGTGHVLIAFAAVLSIPVTGFAMVRWCVGLVHRWRVSRAFARLTDYGTNGISMPIGGKGGDDEYVRWATMTLNKIVSAVELVNVSQGKMLRRTALLPGGGKVHERDVTASRAGLPVGIQSARSRIGAVSDRLDYLLLNGFL